jgi:hypothetical protein
MPRAPPLTPSTFSSRKAALFEQGLLAGAIPTGESVSSLGAQVRSALIAIAVMEWQEEFGRVDHANPDPRSANPDTHEVPFITSTRSTSSSEIYT